MSNWYRVRVGGSANDSGNIYQGIEAAEDAAIQLAVDIATERGEDAESVDGYGGPDCTVWGACPVDDDGAYYPVITADK